MPRNGKLCFLLTSNYLQVQLHTAHYYLKFFNYQPKQIYSCDFLFEYTNRYTHKLQYNNRNYIKCTKSDVWYKMKNYSICTKIYSITKFNSIFSFIADRENWPALWDEVAIFESKHSVWFSKFMQKNAHPVTSCAGLNHCTN